MVFWNRNVLFGRKINLGFSNGLCISYVVEADEEDPFSSDITTRRFIE
jgi:hypothetical protein